MLPKADPTIDALKTARINRAKQNGESVEALYALFDEEDARKKLGEAKAELGKLKGKLRMIKLDSENDLTAKDKKRTHEKLRNAQEDVADQISYKKELQQAVRKAAKKKIQALRAAKITVFISDVQSQKDLKKAEESLKLAQNKEKRAKNLKARTTDKD